MMITQMMMTITADALTVFIKEIPCQIWTNESLVGLMMLVLLQMMMMVLLMMMMLLMVMMMLLMMMPPMPKRCVWHFHRVLLPLIRPTVLSLRQICNSDVTSHISAVTSYISPEVRCAMFICHISNVTSQRPQSDPQFLQCSSVTLTHQIHPLKYFLTQLHRVKKRKSNHDNIISSHHSLMSLQWSCVNKWKCNLRANLPSNNVFFLKITLALHDAWLNVSGVFERVQRTPH